MSGNFLITWESDDEQRTALVFAHPPLKYAQSHPSQKFKYLNRLLHSFSCERLLPYTNVLLIKYLFEN